MKRLPRIFSFFSGLAFCLSLAFWGQSLLSVPINNGIAFAASSDVVSASGHWGNLFGSSQITQDGASNYQLKGVVVAQSAQDSAAIISINGKPAQSLHVNQELAAGVTLSEVHQTHIVIKEAGVEQRIIFNQSAFTQSLGSVAINGGDTVSQQGFNFAKRSRSAPIAIPETTLAEEPLRPQRAEQQSSASELPTASYLAPKMQ